MNYENLSAEQQTVSREWMKLFLAGMYILSMLLPLIFYGGLGSSLKEAYQIGLFSCAFLLPLWIFLYIEMSRSMAEQMERIFLLGLLFFGITMILVLISVHINTCLLWIGGCIFLTVLFPTGIGIGFFLFFGCLFCFINNATMSYEIFMFLLGIVLCSFVSFIKKGKPIIVIVFMALIIYTLLFFVLTRGSSAYFEWQSLVSMIGQAVFLVIAYGLYSILKRTNK